MKNKLFKSLIFAGCLSMVASMSCKKQIDDAYANPNAATREPIESILSGVIGGFTAFFSSAGTGYGVQADAILLGRYIQFWGSQTNGENYGQMGGTTPPSDATGGLWGTVYYGQGGNLNRIIQWGTEEQKWDYVGVGQAIRAWGWLELTNIYGDAILREAFDTTKQQFHYNVQSEFYDSCRTICFRALGNLSRTDGNVSQTNLAIGDAFFYNGDVNKWKKFVYGILARSYQDLSYKAIYTANAYADSAIKYASLSISSNDDNATVKVLGGSISAVNNYFGPFRSNIGTIRQGAYISDLLSGRNTDAFNTIIDPRIWYLLRENSNNTFKGFIPWKGTSSLSNADYPRNYWGNSTFNATTPPSTDTTRYLYQDKSPWPMMTASEMQFIIAEAALIKGDNTTAYTAYKNGIRLNFDMLAATYPQHIPAANQITTAIRDTFMAKTAVVPASASGLTFTHIMLQKYIALYGWGVQETWTDMRKYHYIDLDPLTGNQVYAQFTPPTGNDLISTNNGNLVYRCRPRYNSEYLYDIPELTRLGALNLDYITYQPWFTQK